MRSVALPYWGDDMSVWVVPRTWTSTVLTAADLNVETRDHLLWLKGFADLITNSTAADTGTATQLLIKRTNSTDTSLAAQVAGDTNPRISINAAGRIFWGPGGVAAFDTDIQRTTAGAFGGLLLSGFLAITPTSDITTLLTKLQADANDRFHVTATGLLEWGGGAVAVDAQLKRASAGTLELPASPDTKLQFSASAATAFQAVYRVAGDTVERMAIRADGRMEWGAGSAVARDVSLYRLVANQLAIDGSLVFNDGGIIEMVERVAPANPVADRVRLFCEDNGAGKTRLAVRFPTGSTIVLATEV